MRCFQVTKGHGDTVTVVGVPGIPLPLPLPFPVVVPVVNDTGDSNSNHVDNHVTVYVDVDNRKVVDGDAIERRGQRILATILLLLGMPMVAVVVVLVLRGGVQVATTAEEYDTAETRQQVIHIHSRVNDAIAAGNAELAERSMRQHLGATHARPVSIAATEIPLSDEPVPTARGQAQPAARRARR